MKLKIEYQVREDFLSLEESHQLKLFAKDENMDSAPLKYPRRKTRSIGESQFEIVPPRETTSSTMQKIPSRDTKIELLLEQELKANGILYSKPEFIIEPVDGKPDFVIPRYKIAIFCDGDFWHGYSFDETKIKTNADFWSAKIKKNILRDQEVTYGLQKREWKVFRFWEHEISRDSKECVQKIKDYIKIVEADVKSTFTFVDLFAGIGGFRIPLEELGGKCLGFSEIDKDAILVYKKNFFDSTNSEELELGDITKIEKLPFKNIDLIVGGVPCQAWSVAGKMKGFEDPRGRLWHDSIRVVEANKPKAFIFENVKGLMDPRNRKSLDLIIESFKEIGYVVKPPQILNSYDFGLPQNRDRIFIVGIRKDLSSFLNEFEYPKAINKKSFLADLIDIKEHSKTLNVKRTFNPEELFGDKIPMSRNRFQKLNEVNDFFIFCDTRNGHTTIHSWDINNTTNREKIICMVILKNRRKKIYGDSDGNPLTFSELKELISDLKKSELIGLVKKRILRIVESDSYELVNSKNSAGVNGVYRIYLPISNIFSTLTATGSKDMVALKNIDAASPKEYKEKFISEIVKPKLFRPITAKEAGKLQGFPNWFSIHPNEKFAKKQFGNAVSTTVIYHLSKSLLSTKIFNIKNE